MGGGADEVMDRIMSAAARVADGRVDDLIGEARADAEAEVRELLKTAMKSALLRRVMAAMEGDQPRVEVVARRPAASGQSGGPTETACYVYCIVPARRCELPQEVRGVGDATDFEMVPHESVAAITSRVSLSEFGQAAMEQRFRDAQWLEREVRAHERVVRAAMQNGGGVIPLRFCTILHSRDDVRSVLRQHHEHLRQVLASLEGAEEWGVKFYHQPRRGNGAQAAKAAGGAGDAHPTSGREYLTKKRRGLLNRSDEQRAAHDRAREAHERLSSLVRDAAELVVDDRAAGAGTSAKRLLLNAAYLVADENEQQFQAAVAEFSEELGPAGVVCEVTGPWPPYNFVNLDLSLPAAAR